MQTNDMEWKITKPPEKLTGFVKSFWMLANHADKEHQMVILPDGRVDVVFSWSAENSFQGILKGLDTEPVPITLTAHTTLFAISFKLLAIDFLIDIKIPSILNDGIPLPAGFGISCMRTSKISVSFMKKWRPH